MSGGETGSNGVHPDRLNGYPLPFFYDISSLPFCNGNSITGTGSHTHDTGKFEPELTWKTGDSVAGVKRKWLDTYSADNTEGQTGCLDGLLCHRAQNCLLTSSDSVGIHSNQVKRICLQEPITLNDVDMEHTPPCYHDNLPFSSPLHNQLITGQTLHSDSNLVTNTLSLPSSKKPQFCTGILSEVGDCHHSDLLVLGLGALECPRCLAGESGHLEHIVNHQQAMDTNC